MKSEIARMVEIKNAQAALKSEWDDLEALFLKKCAEDLADTKRKTVEYLGPGGKVTATMADTVGVIYPTYLKAVFGEAYKDAVSESTKYTLSKPASRMLAGLYTGNYSETTRAEIIEQLPCDETAKLALVKKLKGASFDTDKKNLMKIGGVDEATAEHYAYFIAEAMIWESFTRLMSANGLEGDAATDTMMKTIEAAIIVEQTPKIKLEILEGC